MSTPYSYLSNDHGRWERKKKTHKKTKKSSSFTSKRFYRPLRYHRFEKHRAKSLKHSKPERLKKPTNKKRSNRSLRYRIRGKTSVNKKCKRKIYQDSLSHSRRLSETKWQHQERKTQQEQKEFLEGYSNKFKDVPVSSQTKNVRRGDHIFRQGTSSRFYTHHLLCTSVDEEGISVIEYAGNGPGLSSSSRSAAASNVFAFAAIKKGKLTYEELEENEAKIRKWPKELERFDTDEVISRAESRSNERDYHAFNNNCEHFVTWCKCGLNTSLQVKPWYKSVWDTVKGLPRAVISQSIPSSFVVAGMVVDELPEAVFSALSPVGLVVVPLIELGLASHSVWKDYKRIKEKRLSRKQFRVNLAVSGSKAVARIAGSIVGSVIGTAFGPLGSILGGFLGYCVGHVVGLVVKSYIENEPKIKKKITDYVVSPVTNMVNEVKAAHETIGKGIKRIAKRLVGK